MREDPTQRPLLRRDPVRGARKGVEKLVIQILERPLEAIILEVIVPQQLHPLGVIQSEEHTSELQSQFHLVCRLLLEKKKKHIIPSTRLRHSMRQSTTNLPTPIPTNTAQSLSPLQIHVSTFHFWPQPMHLPINNCSAR